MKPRGIVAVVAALALEACAQSPNYVQPTRFPSEEVDTPFAKVTIFRNDEIAEDMSYYISCKHDKSLRFLGLYKKGNLHLYINDSKIADLSAFFIDRRLAEDFLFNDNLCGRLTKT